jgi:hypothetical protein
MLPWTDREIQKAFVSRQHSLQASRHLQQRPEIFLLLQHDLGEPLWDRESSQSYTPAEQRRAVRRATPATLTGVSGRPTTASAGETKLYESGIIRHSGSTSPKNPTIPVSSTILNILHRDILIGHLR